MYRIAGGSVVRPNKRLTVRKLLGFHPGFTGETFGRDFTGERLHRVFTGEIVLAVVGFSWYGVGVMARTKQASVGLPAARMAFFYGVGNGGEPCRDREKLQEIAGVTDKTILVHLEKWNKELAEKAENRQDMVTGTLVKPESVEYHSADVFFLRANLDKIKEEIDNLDDTQAEIWSLVSSLQDLNVATSEQIDSLISLVDRYLKKSCNRQNLLGLFLQLQKRWQDSSGMTGTIDAAVAGMKEVEKSKRLAELRVNHPTKTMDDSSGSGPKHLRDSNVFRR